METRHHNLIPISTSVATNWTTYDTLLKTAIIFQQLKEQSLNFGGKLVMKMKITMVLTNLSRYNDKVKYEAIS